MDRDELLRELSRLVKGELTPQDLAGRIAPPACRDLGFARIDLDRTLRRGFPEVILGQFKTAEQNRAIVQSMADDGLPVLVTRLDPPEGATLAAAFPAGVYVEHARCFCMPWPPPTPQFGPVGVVTAGTSDIPVAEEARITLAMMACETFTIYDAGVAGLHRLLDNLELLRSARALVVIAGMDGALPSVVGGLLACPVVAVPTSVGYGTSFNGVAALLGMLNTCTPGVAVVNIDAGFSAAYLAGMIARAGCIDENT